MDFNVSIDAIEKLTKIAAIIVAGLWVYFNTIKGRIFIPRIQVDVSGNILSQNDNRYLFVDMQVKNVGSSIAVIKEHGSGLTVSSLISFGDASEVIGLIPERVTGFNVFNFKKGEIKKIEPGTSIKSQELIEIPKNRFNAFKLELKVTAFSESRFVPDRLMRAIAVVLNE